MTCCLQVSQGIAGKLLHTVNSMQTALKEACNLLSAGHAEDDRENMTGGTIIGEPVSAPRPRAEHTSAQAALAKAADTLTQANGYISSTVHKAKQYVDGFVQPHTPQPPSH